MAGKNLLNSIQLKKPNKNWFDLSHPHAFSLDMGRLIPTLAMECVPGDKIKIGSDAIVRFAPMVTPVMHRFDVTMHYFFVPNRLLWENWEKFITQTKDPVTGLLPAFPTIQMNAARTQSRSQADYLGLPEIQNPGEYNVSALPFAACLKIYDEYYRAQRFTDPLFEKLQDGEQTNAYSDILTQVRYRAWEHDYFTSALPEAQLGASVDIPLGEVSLKEAWKDGQIDDNPFFVDTNNTALSPGDSPTGQFGPDGPYIDSPTAGEPFAYDPNGTLEVEATTINDLRRAFKLQEWLEKAMRAGSRYTESILAHFGVRSSDARLQRPEYITGSKSPVVVSEVLNTTGTDSLPQGNMAGHAFGTMAGKLGSYFCEEHGYIIGIMSVLPKTSYFQGVPKHFLKTQDPFQYYWPEFAHIGEQEILNQEVYVEHTNPTGVFGYTPRYAEYKFVNGRISGDFKTNLDSWHAARKFTSSPNLNSEFINANPTKRIFAVADPDVDSLYAHVYHKIMAQRPMPKFGTPTF